MSALPRIGTRITMSCHEGVWEILEGRQQCRFRGKVRLVASSIEYPMHPVQVIEEQLEWIFPIPTPLLVADPEQVTKTLSLSRNSKKDDFTSDDKGKRLMDEFPKKQPKKAELRCFRCGGAHLHRNCHLRQQTQQRSRVDNCYVCGKQGHRSRDCRYAVKLPHHSSRRTG